MDHDEITDRLRALGAQPVPDATTAAHLRRMAEAPGATPRRFGRLAVAAAAMVGFFAGSTGLAMAGALPEPAQDVAHDVLSVVRVQVPEGDGGHRGTCVSRAAKIADPVAKAEAKAQCPPGGPPPWAGPDGEGDPPGRSGSTPGGPAADEGADDPCRGKPPWAGPGKTAEERIALKAEHGPARNACPDDAEDPAEGN